MYIPVPIPAPSIETVELADYLRQIVDAYRGEHPELTEDEIRDALAMAAPTDNRATVRGVKALVVGLLALGTFAYLIVARTGGGPIPWLTVAVGGLVIVFAVLFLAARRR